MMTLKKTFSFRRKNTSSPAPSISILPELADGKKRHSKARSASDWRLLSPFFTGTAISPVYGELEKDLQLSQKEYLSTRTINKHPLNWPMKMNRHFQSTTSLLMTYLQEIHCTTLCR
jgi:hypothetical protein